MRVAYFAPEMSTVPTLSDALRAAGHQVAMARDEKDLVRLMADEKSELVVLHAEAPTPRLIDAARAAAEASIGAYVLLLHAGATEDYVARVLEAGADGDIPLPLSARYFGARMTAIRRSVRRGLRDAATAASPPRVPEARGIEPRASRATISGRVDWGATNQQIGYVASAATPRATLIAKPKTPIEEVSRSTAWSLAPELLRDATARFFGVEATCAEVPDATSVAQGLGASIVLLSAERQLEIRISLSIDARSAQSLVDAMLGGGDWAEMAQPMLGELANVYMGTLQAALTQSAIAFTSGLPEVVPASAVLQPPLPYRHHHALRLETEQGGVVAHIGLRSRANVRLGARLLREGMVLAEDLTNERGVLLANGGTRLSANMVERLRHAMVPSNEIEVLAP